MNCQNYLLITYFNKLLKLHNNLSTLFGLIGENLFIMIKMSREPKLGTYLGNLPKHLTYLSGTLFYNIKLYMKKPERTFSWSTFFDVFDHRLMMSLSLLLLGLTIMVYLTIFYFVNDYETHLVDDGIIINPRKLQKSRCVSSHFSKMSLLLIH